MQTILIAIHGIMTRQADPSWPDQFEAWALQRDPELHVVKKEYRAGPFPWWNCWVKDPLLARSLANELELFFPAPTLDTQYSVPPSTLNFKPKISSTSDLRRETQDSPLSPSTSATRHSGLFPSGLSPSPACQAVASERRLGGEGRPALRRLCEGGGEGGISSTSDLRHETQDSALSLWFVAHSNGAVIALLAARRLIERGHRVGGLILTGAACEADVAKNGILEWSKAGRLGAAIAYSSEDDEVVAGDPAHSSLDTRHPALSRLRDWLWGKLIWPYGCLGRTGWLCQGKPLTAATLQNSSPSPIHQSINPAIQFVFTRWFPGGHTTYFAPWNINQTFEQIYDDITTAGHRSQSCTVFEGVWAKKVRTDPAPQLLTTNYQLLTTDY